MTWLVRMLGIDKARAAFARLADSVNAFRQEFDEAAAKLRGVKPPALEDKGRKAKAAQEA
jgi:hypothetical protein